jgi:CheY-like chemotaxis protein
MNPPRILVVDDSLTIRRALEFILKPQGYAVEFAADGRESIAKAAEFDPDLVLLDYVLPDMRGPDICAALASMPVTAHTPVILVSAKGASVRQAYQDAENVVSYITKPFKPQVVTSVVANALARSGAGSGFTPLRGAKVEPPGGRTLPVRSDSAHVEARAGLPANATADQAFAALLDQLEETMVDHELGETPRLVAILRGVVERFAEVGDHVTGESLTRYRLRPDGSFADILTTLLDAHRALCTAALAIAAHLPRPVVPPIRPRVLVACPGDHPLHAIIVEELGAGSSGSLTIEDEFARLPHLVRLLEPEWAFVATSVAAALGEPARTDLNAAAASGMRVIALGRSGEEPFDDAAFQFFKQIDDPGDLRNMLRALLAEIAAEEPETASQELEIVSLEG